MTNGSTHQVLEQEFQPSILSKSGIFQDTGSRFRIQVLHCQASYILVLFFLAFVRLSEPFDSDREVDQQPQLPNRRRTYLPLLC